MPVLYDRGGTGWSEPVELPRSAAEVATELREALHAAGVPGPHVLVGHSLGTFYVRRFAQLYPDEVAGLVLVEPGHEDITDYLPLELAEMNARMKESLADLPDLTEEQITAARAQYTVLYAAWPPDLRDALIDHHLTDWRTQL